MMEFLTFKVFISTDVLIVFYYIGAVIVPVGVWLLVNWFIRKYSFFDDALRKARSTVGASINKKQKAILAIVFVLSFLFMEIVWRMMFEFLIAYMQIRDALVAS